VIYDNTYCTNKPCETTALFRTFKYCDENGVFKDKHGEYIDFKNSIIGKQYQLIDVNGVRYFRYSIAKYWKLGKKALIWELKTGLGSTNYEIQNRFGIKKINYGKD
jgi:hypothetical protein